MKKDIEIPLAQGVHLAAIKQWNEEFGEEKWTAFLINEREDALEMLLVVSKAYQGETRSSTLRHKLDKLAPKSAARLEIIQDDLLALTNEFFVTYFAEGKLFERKFLFPAKSLEKNPLTLIPLMEEQGILAS